MGSSLLSIVSSSATYLCNVNSPIYHVWLIVKIIVVSARQYAALNLKFRTLLRTQNCLPVYFTFSLLYYIVLNRALYLEFGFFFLFPNPELVSSSIRDKKLFTSFAAALASSTRRLAHAHGEILTHDGSFFLISPFARGVLL